jgi:hypothetical protein
MSVTKLGRHAEDVDKQGVAETCFYPTESFTVAAIGDGGATGLTLALSSIKDKPHHFQ